MNAEAILQQVFGFEKFRPLQKLAIDGAISGRDCLVVLPTGAGKSLCYQIPALAKNGVTVVVSPLISLMKDQVDALRSHGIAAAFWNSSLSHSEADHVVSQLHSNQLRLLYVAPERFTNTYFTSLLQKIPVTLVAIDEAHCVSEWGHDFRPDYRHLSRLKELLPGVPRMALTASATTHVSRDIEQSLGLDTPVIVKGSFDRPNLHYEVRSKQDATGEILSFLQSAERGSGVIYCGSRKRVEDVASSLQRAGFNALPYHAGLSRHDRDDHQTRFIRDEVPIVVATIAFGMGIDKPNIRFVIHYDMPKSLENYYQETGRGGRDGLPSSCLLFHSYSDRRILESFIDKVEDPEEQRRQRQKLLQMDAYAARRKCRRATLLQYFGEEYPSKTCGNCDVCSGDQKLVDATEIAYKVICAVIRLEQRVGVVAVIDTLRGMDNQKIRALGAQNLSVYGIAKELSRGYVREVVQQLCGEGYLEISTGDYPIVLVPAKGTQAVYQREKILLHLPDPVEKAKKERVTKKELDYDDGLYDALRTLRKRLAVEADVPPYSVFPDRSLQEMSYYLPQTSEQLLMVSGVGDFKLGKYGTLFLKEIAAYASLNGLQPKERRAATPLPKRAVSQSRLEEVRALTEREVLLPEIAETLGLKESTLGGYLERLLEEGAVKDPHLYVSQEIVEAITPYIQEKPNLFLRELKDKLKDCGKEYSWEDLRLARAHALFRAKL